MFVNASCENITFFYICIPLLFLLKQFNDQRAVFIPSAPCLPLPETHPVGHAGQDQPFKFAEKRNQDQAVLLL